MNTRQILKTPPGFVSEEVPENAVRILEAAIELFATKGYAATSVREIVQLAQVTNPMLYYYFDSKEGLFRVLTDLLHESFATDVRAVLASEISFREALVRVVDAHLRGLREAPRVVEFVYTILFGSEGSCPGHQLYERHQFLVDELAERFEAAVEAGEFRVREGLDMRWLALQLLGLANSHSMFGIKELKGFATDDERSRWIEEHAGVAHAHKIVDFFLAGAGEVLE